MFAINKEAVAGRHVPLLRRLPGGVDRAVLRTGPQKVGDAPLPLTGHRRQRVLQIMMEGVAALPLLPTAAALRAHLEPPRAQRLVRRPELRETFRRWFDGKI